MRRLGELDALAGTVRAQALALDGDARAGTPPDEVVWAEALGATIASHARDVDTMLPWVPRLLAEGGTWSAARSGALEVLAASVPTLADSADRCEAAMREVAALRGRPATGADGGPGAIGAVDALSEALEHSAAAGSALMRRLGRLAASAQAMATGMDFGFLFDPVRRLLSIGYRATDGTLDAGRYDLLASEARLASFFAIAKGDVPVSHWFRLGRALTPVERDSILLSWSGSMFEYLMPALVMRAPPGSLLEQTGRLAVAAADHVRARARRAVGRVRGGLQRARSGDDVSVLELRRAGPRAPPRPRARTSSIAPYATGLAAMVDPAAAVRNFRRLAEAGACGAFGFYEAIDYTASRRPAGTAGGHRPELHGASPGHDDRRDRQCRACRRDARALPRRPAGPGDRAAAPGADAPRCRVLRPRDDEATGTAGVREFVTPVVRRFTSPHDGDTAHASAVQRSLRGDAHGRRLRVQPLAGRGDHPVAGGRRRATSAGRTCSFARSGAARAGRPATSRAAREPDSYEVVFSEGRADIARRDGAFATTLEVIVSPEDDAEIRRVSITNLGTGTRDVEVTSYAEIVLAPPAADAAHPAFSNLFVCTEALPDQDAVLATRRPRAAADPQLWLAHVVVVEGETVGELEWETDRARFLGRGRGIRAPLAQVDGRPLSGTVGAVLDPVVSLRRRVRLRPGAHRPRRVLDDGCAVQG